MGNRLPSELGNNSVKIKTNHPSEFQSKIASQPDDRCQVVASSM